MAGDFGTLYRNHSMSDTTVYNRGYQIGSALPTVESLGWSAPSGAVFKEWNTSRDGTGSGFNPGEYDQTFSVFLYAIWESPVENIEYITNSQEITSIANAIRTKGGTSASLIYPAGFVSAIQNISTGTDVSDTTATASDVRTGKYFYTAAGVKTQGSIANGSATTPATTITANPSISVNSSGLITATNSKTQSVTPTVSAGYVANGTAGTITVSGSNTSQLTTQAAQTITPTTTDQTIASGKYLTGTQTIKGDANLIAENIAKDVTIFGVTGTHEGGGGGGAEKQVTINLIFPISPSAFQSFTIYEMTGDVQGQQIGSISSATGSTTVTVGANADRIICYLQGGYVMVPFATYDYYCNGGAGLNYVMDGGPIRFAITGDATIDISGIDWDD